MAKLPPPPPAPRGAGAVVPAPAGARRARRPAAPPPPPPPAPRIAAPAGGRRRTPPAAPAVRVVAARPAGGPPPAPAPVAPPLRPATGQSNWLVGLIIVALGLFLWYFNPFGGKEVVEQARPAVTATQPGSTQVVEPPVAQPAPRTAVEQRLDATASKPLSEMSYSECEQYWLIVRGKVMEGYGNHHWSDERGCQ